MRNNNTAANQDVCVFACVCDLRLKETEAERVMGDLSGVTHKNRPFHVLKAGQY